ncbi:hypothetical protein KCU62_g216, partial [Aureobasidium sp. EXF-3399]
LCSYRRRWWRCPSLAFFLGSGASLVLLEVGLDEASVLLQLVLGNAHGQQLVEHFLYGRIRQVQIVRWRRPSRCSTAESETGSSRASTRSTGSSIILVRAAPTAKWLVLCVLVCILLAFSSSSNVRRRGSRAERWLVVGEDYSALQTGILPSVVVWICNVQFGDSDGVDLDGGHDGETRHSQVVEQRYVSRGGPTRAPASLSTRRPPSPAASALQFCPAATCRPIACRLSAIIPEVSVLYISCYGYDQIFTCLFGLVLSWHCIPRRRRQRPSLKEDARENKKDAQRCLKW